MRHAHSQTQIMFRQIGEQKGYRVSSTYSKSSPTDGIWWKKLPFGQKEIPIVAIEVCNSESLKSMKGSIGTLAEVSPAIGILLIHELDIRRRCIRNGKSASNVEKIIAKKFADARNYASKLHQRIEVWSYEQLKYVHKFGKKKYGETS
jgi:hypothetical protein